ncbi:hypothetical protein CKAH01_00052 [Colletotrichum kahawae]|uniref:Uncharacterized protein n=1 Tax=Colletotrichum kahawae TaxID=34407 RepID=A0AAD9YWV7_COLKA|nr:hypothetical protein CKAH01_00052 [Colletotrichum kahawae]
MGRSSTMGSHNSPPPISSPLSISVSVSDSACPLLDGLENRMRPRRRRRTRSPHPKSTPSPPMSGVVPSELPPSGQRGLEKDQWQGPGSECESGSGPMSTGVDGGPNAKGNQSRHLHLNSLILTADAPPTADSPAMETSAAATGKRWWHLGSCRGGLGGCVKVNCLRSPCLASQVPQTPNSWRGVADR